MDNTCLIHPCLIAMHHCDAKDNQAKNEDNKYILTEYMRPAQTHQKHEATVKKKKKKLEGHIIQLTEAHGQPSTISANRHFCTGKAHNISIVQFHKHL